MYKFICVVCSTLALALGAHAQEAEKSQEGEKAKQGSLEEVMVLATRAAGATKTDTAIVEIPQSISVVTADQIEEHGAVNYQDVFRYSGVDTERSGLEVRSDFFSIRGFALKQYVDGLNKTPDFVYGSRQEVFTLELVEVLRGPSAVMYGAGSSGGLVNAVSKRPRFEFGGSLGVQLGNFERKQVQADITGPLGGNFAGRIVGIARDGELLSPGQANDKYVVMPSLTWQPSERTQLTLLTMFSQEDLGTHTYLPTQKTLNASPADPAIPHDLFIGEPGFNHMKADEYDVTLLFTHRFNDRVAFSSSSRYIDQDVDYAEVYGFPPWSDAARTLLQREFYVLDGYYYTYNSDNNLQVDFTTGALEHKVLFGVDWTLFEHGRQEGFSCRGTTAGTCWDGGSPPPLDVYNPVYGQPFTFGFTNAFETESTQLGFYLQDQMRWNDRVSFVLGVRRDRATNERINTPPKFENNATTFKAGVIGEVIEGVSPYVSYSESFTPLFGTDFFGNHFSPQEATQWEGGVKWQPNRNSLVTGAYFDIEETGFLSRDPNNIQNRLQGGAIGVKGFEFEAILGFANGFGLTANYTNVDAEILEGTVSQPAGTRVPNLPEEIGSVWLNKRFVVSDEFAWRIGAGARRNGDEVDGGQLTTTPAVTLVDASAEVSFRDWNISLNVNNVGDKEYYASCGVTTCAPGVTRTILGTITKTF